MSTPISMKRSFRNLSIIMVIHRVALKITESRPSPVLASYLKHGLVFTVLISEVLRIITQSLNTFLIILEDFDAANFKGYIFYHLRSNPNSTSHYVVRMSQTQQRRFVEG